MCAKSPVSGKHEPPAPLWTFGSYPSGLHHSSQTARMARTIVPVAQATIVAPAGSRSGFTEFRKAAGNLTSACNLRGSQLGKQSVANYTGKGISMLGFLFGFNARIGRLHFFFSTIVVTIMMVAIYIARHHLRVSDHPKGTDSQPDLGADLRRRDPVHVAHRHAAVDAVQGYRMGSGVRASGVDRGRNCRRPRRHQIPAMSLGHERGTIFGALVNLSLILALLFCPSGAQDSPAPTSDEPVRTPDPPPHRPVADPPAAPRISRPATGGFGRRGL